jgi:hypothetical protein
MNDFAPLGNVDLVHVREPPEPLRAADPHAQFCIIQDNITISMSKLLWKLYTYAHWEWAW